MFEGDAWINTLGMTTPKRKPGRELGTTVKEVEMAAAHKRKRPVQAAVAAGRQMRRQAFPPLLPVEVEPGVAAGQATEAPFPFDSEEGLADDFQRVIEYVADHQSTIVQTRADLVEAWTQRAHDLAQDSIDFLESEAVSDYGRGILLRGYQLGEFFHVALFHEMLASLGYADMDYPYELARGMNVVGPISPSNVWPRDPDLKRCSAKIDVATLEEGAWEYRKHVASTFRMDEYSQKAYDATLEDLEKKYAEGPFHSEQEVSDHLDTDRWVVLRRLGIWQKGKVRPIDDAHANWANFTSARLEKLITSSVDMIVNLIRSWSTIYAERKEKMSLGAWAMDEEKAYRQVPVASDQRRFSVVAVINPNQDQTSGDCFPTIEYFVMSGHCFGFTNAVYNYNRRPMAITQILRRIFHIPTDHYYDDRWGIEPMASVPSAFSTTEAVFKLLGILVQSEKAQGPETVEVPLPEGGTKVVETVSKDHPWQLPDLLGVTFDLENLLVKIKDSRKEEIKEELDTILEKKSLHPGHASKLRGKLFFLTSTLFGRIGRAFMKPLSERQYMHGGMYTKGAKFKDYLKLQDAPGTFALTPVLEEALISWRSIVDTGKPRPIHDRRLGPADAVFFSDGAGPTDEEPDVPPKVGAVLFAWWREAPMAFGVEIDQDLMDKWIPRKNQIIMIELLAVVLVLKKFGNELSGKRITGLIDSEPVLDALIKGQSQQEDMQKLIRVFWDLVAHHNIIIYLDRVSTDSNPADGMSRDGQSEAEALGWHIVPIEQRDLDSL